MGININCDMGESFGLYQMGDDEGIIPYITQANIACGYHASDPNHMRKTVQLAKENNVKIGAHFSLPDLAGFGRREMKLEREELKNMVVYQVGALCGFLDMYGVKLNHLKPHGSLYGMAAKQAHIAHAIADAGELYRVPIFGLAGTLHEEIYTARGLEFCPEFYADLAYDSSGQLIITREHATVDAKASARRCVKAVEEGTTMSIDGKEIPISASSICVHSDTPNAKEVAAEIFKSLKHHLN
ncbi:MAG: 5-oxoprolinase subunit PxpA [Gammaproteobacteria bacterium]|nr:5-oxoprolinase subunit PxpA [Gammaproteobacteria bacterium]